MTRLYLGGFKFSHKQDASLPLTEELQERFGQVQDVQAHESYVHFTLPEVSEEALKKFKAKYNGSLWKGSKVRLEVAQPQKITVCGETQVLVEEKPKEIRRTVRHCGDLQVVSDGSGKVRKGWVRSKGGRHVMQEIKVRRPDGKVKTVDVNVLYKKNILTFPVNADQEEHRNLNSIWTEHGYDLTPEIIEPPALTIEPPAPAIEPSAAAIPTIVKVAAVVEDVQVSTANDAKVNKVEAKKEPNFVCKWNEVQSESVSFSLFPTPIIPTPISVPTVNDKVIKEIKEKKPKRSIEESAITVKKEEPQKREEPAKMEFILNLAQEADNVISSFVNKQLDLNQYKRHTRPLLRKDIRQQRKQHMRTFRRASKTTKFHK